MEQPEVLEARVYHFDIGDVVIALAAVELGHHQLVTVRLEGVHNQRLCQ